MEQSKIHQDESQTVLKAVSAKIAIMVGVLSAIFYIALTTTTDPLAAVSPLDTAPLDPVPPALQMSQAPDQGQAMPQGLALDLPDGDPSQPKSESGNVMTYEHD